MCIPKAFLHQILLFVASNFFDLSYYPLFSKFQPVPKFIKNALMSKRFKLGKSNSKILILPSSTPFKQLYQT